MGYDGTAEISAEIPTFCRSGVVMDVVCHPDIESVAVPSRKDVVLVLSGLPVIYIVKAFFRVRNIVATLLAYNVKYYFTQEWLLIFIVC